jgi:1-acyl-sn-glycerol-3-phosphate acyltransferase
MDRPDLVPENHVAIYEYFRNFQPSKKIQDIGFGLMHFAYSSDVHYEDGASEMIQGHLVDGGSAILAPNHQSYVDTPTLAGIVYEETFAELRGRTIIPAKAEMFDWFMFGRFFPHMMAHPTFRSKYFARTEDGQKLREQVTNSLIQLNIDHINNGGCNALFPESTRNNSDPHIVQKLKTGIGKIAAGVEDPSKLLVIPMGYAYRNTLGPIKLRPLIVVTKPFCPKDMTIEGILQQTYENMQAATTKAFSLAE